MLKNEKMHVTFPSQIGTFLETIKCHELMITATPRLFSFVDTCVDWLMLDLACCDQFLLVASFLRSPEVHQLADTI